MNTLDSQGLRAAAGGIPEDGTTVADLLGLVPGAHLPWLVMLFALPSSLPGLQLGWICAPVLLSLAAAAWRGQTHVQVPAWVRQRKVGSTAARKLLAAMAWTHDRLRAWCRPTWPAVVSAAQGRPAAVLVAGMALLILLPLPGSNFLPSLALAAVAAGWLWSDGRAHAVAWLLALASIALLAMFGWIAGALASAWGWA